MSRLLVTGADGFVGRWLVRAARAEGREVLAATGPDAAPVSTWLTPAEAAGVEAVPVDLRGDDLLALARRPFDDVVHLAAIASGAEARKDPAAATAVNAVATLRFADAVAARGGLRRFLFVSTGEVYGAGHDGPIAESAPVRPVSPYAESKAVAERALRERVGIAGFPLLVARAFPHTGPGQSPAYVLPALAARLRAARAEGAATIPVGNLDAVRDFLDVRDVVRAYLLLLAHGAPGEVVNVASGTGHRLSDCFTLLARLLGTEAVPAQDAALLRPADIPVLIGDAGRLRALTGWSPRIAFERTLQDLVDAQAD